MWARLFHFILFRFPSAPRACRSTGPIKMKSSMPFIRGNRCMEGMVIRKTNDDGTFIYSMSVQISAH